MSMGSSYAQTATLFNAQVQNTMDSLNMYASLWMHTLSFIQDSNSGYTGLTPYRTDLQEYIDEQTEQYETMKDVAGSDKLRGAILGLLKFEKQLVKKSFIPFEELPQGASKSQVNELKTNLRAEAAGEGSLLQAVNRARKEYADDNHISLIPPPPAKPVNTKP
ncbi:MAG: hypothetical protein EBX41_07680, partial [Chitinophagia bacterium]|nr:hypothetical protein [Chitinophagia bacterium]